MRFVRSIIAVLAFGFALAAAASAEDSPRVAVMKDNIAKAMQSESNTAQFWRPVGNGTVREMRSGMICAGELSADMPLDFLSGPVPVSPMSVVGCIYRSADKNRVVHIILSPNLLGAAETRKMLRMALDYTDKEVVSLGASPIAGFPDGEEEALTSVAEGKPRLHYMASATAGSWLVVVHAIEPRPEKIDVNQARSVPVTVLTAALATITAAGR